MSSDLRPPTSDLGPRTSDFGPRTSDFGPRTSDFGPRTSDFGPPVSYSLVFALREEAAIEDFGGRSLVFLCDSLRLREVNELPRRLLALLDGKRSIQDIALLLASDGGTASSDIREHIGDALLQMERQGIVRRVVKLSMERPEKMSEAKYIVNPDVSFRQEDDEGGILFNVDTDCLEIINPTAVEIWTFLSAPRTQAEVVTHLCEVCADALPEQVEKDVGEFIESLLEKGFIGVVENPL